MSYFKKTRTNHADTYTAFLEACELAMGSLNPEKLDKNPQFKADFFKQLARIDDPELFKLAELINKQ